MSPRSEKLSTEPKFRLSFVENEPRNATKGNLDRLDKQFSIQRMEPNRPGTKSIVIQIRMKQPSAESKPVLYKKQTEFWLSSEK
jgi:hypothetical protein